MQVTIAGSGGWGTALAMLLEQNRHAVTLWSHDPKKAEQLKLKRENPLLPGVQLPVELQITNDLNCLKDAELVVFAPPSFALRAVAKEAAPYLPDGVPLLSVTKGIERGTHLRMSQVIAQETGGEHPIAVLSGPSHAEEVARAMPTGVVAASNRAETAELVQRVFTNERFRVYTHDDMVGVELAGALKNVAALCCGVSDGLGLGDNTKALLLGRPASNILLYGDAGTGKSSTVKAIANEFAPDGLRLIEVKKNQLYQIPALMDELAKNPLKFILFIDDLSFASNDDNFAALKAILEGGVGGRSHNVAVYATSNRRHLVKETMADRSGDDLHAMDTRQELMSLSARFGLTVTFQQPDKDRYDRILLELAKQYNVQMPSDQLFIKGAAFALRAGGRSPRVAKQFVELLAAGVKV